MRLRTALAALIALAGCTVNDAAHPPLADSAAEAAASILAADEEPGFHLYSTGEGLFMYHQAAGDCDALSHSHGRNAAWGYWQLPLSRVIDHGVEASGEDGVVVRFTCTDAADCIGVGTLGTTSEQTGEHAIPFGTPERAGAYLAMVADLKSACAAAE